MRLPIVLFASLLFALACGGSSPPDGSLGGSVAVAAAAPRHNVQRESTGAWPSTPEGACARMIECDCNPTGSHQACVAQHKLGMKVMGGALDLQGDIVELGLQGDNSPEAELMRQMMATGGDVMQEGMAANVAMMANMDCRPLCEAIREQQAELAR